MRRSPAAALWYALAILVVVGGPAAVVFVLGTPELALPSEWADARARIDDGTLPAGAVVDIVSVVLVLAWGAGLWFLLAGVLKRDESTHDESTRDESTHDADRHPDHKRRQRARRALVPPGPTDIRRAVQRRVPASRRAAR